MTDSDDTTSTRPISVAELLAKNGTIGAPPAGGRRRRRRGNSDAVTVAELTGEIPIVNTGSMRALREPVAEPVAEVVEAPSAKTPVERSVEPPVEEPSVEEPAAEDVAPEPEAEPEPDAEVEAELEPELEAEPETEPEAEPELEPEPVLTEAELDYQAHLDRRDVDHDPVDFLPRPRRPKASTTGAFAAQSGAEQMSPDPVVDDDEMLDLGPDVDFGEVLDKHTSDDDDELRQETPSYLRSNTDTLFGGQSVADDLARRGRTPGPEDIDLGDDDSSVAETVAVTVDEGTARESAEAPTRSDDEGSAFVRGVWVVVQCILAVAFGAGLFIAFDQLWRWNTIVALVLSVLVILGLVVGVRVVRKTEDIGSTLIAVAVGALVTLGPLALLQSH
ncbi:hypothetical protein ASD37_09160 [Mycobacterium sp. Root135]|uniref:hypothetical protein n=1 Tax=Mycobacterium sp. Root135 TaxID=1736457 RepID=UPI0006F24BF8|nr:hypothetical protein [Mycobacterium sp. Root135]KQY08106.1 hypothetical protein ASD37_09160 [Mycobacterium sp. Root135]